MYRLVLGPLMELLLETPRNPSLHTTPPPSLIPPSISLPPAQAALSSRTVGGAFVTDGPRAVPPPTPPSRRGHSSLLSRG